MNIAIFFGTETGNAEMLADDLSTALEEAHETTVANLSDTAPEALRQADLNIILCSSYGDGELPASAQPFAERLAANPPALDGVRIAVFGLGDREYHDTFGNGSMQLADSLAGRGATLVGDRVVHDAASGELPEDIALPWAEAIIAGLEQT
ncbi:flavodoxin domain-containing protein [Marinibacterium sp. SX1]|uniref:flavodoxin domain-containing protein n=1 Tax=Marinibacterium sp. SX1 TaxID=3388424 RepID=UPI003D16EDCF